MQRLPFLPFGLAFLELNYGKSIELTYFLNDSLLTIALKKQVFVLCPGVFIRQSACSGQIKINKRVTCEKNVLLFGGIFQCREAIPTLPSRVLPLSQAGQAQELSQGGHIHGKIVLQVVNCEQFKSGHASKAVLITCTAKPSIMK